MSRRTFSNYFANKEDAVLHADRERMRTLLRLVRDRPGAERPWLAVRRAATGMYRETPPDLEWVKQLRLLRRHPSLLARLMAATFLATVRTSGLVWLEQSGNEPFPDVLERLLNRIHPR